MIWVYLVLAMFAAVVIAVLLMRFDGTKRGGGDRHGGSDFPG